MDQELLVTEQIAAGKRFLDAFGRHVPVKVAFWLKTSPDAGWYLFVAPDGFKFEDVRKLYEEVYHVTKDLRDPNFSQFRVNLVSPNDPFARAALDVYRDHPAPIPAHFQGRSFGGMGVEGVYIYPPAVPVT